MEKKTKGKMSDYSVLSTVGWAFMVVATVAMAFAIIPMAWCIPMTIHCKHKLQAHQQPSIGFKVCALLFVGFIGGLLLLCDSGRGKKSK